MARVFMLIGAATAVLSVCASEVEAGMTAKDLLTDRIPTRHRRPKAAELTSSYTYTQYLHDWGKRAAEDPEEHRLREVAFRNKLSAVLEHNRDPRHTYRQGLNHLSDRLAEEIAAMLMTTARQGFLEKRWASPTAALAGTPLPASRLQRRRRQAAGGTSLDYRQSSPPVLTPVKDQGVCGSCWAFASVETLESQIALQGGPLATLSEQQLISCAPIVDVEVPLLLNASGTFGGCHGYIPGRAYNYLATVQDGVLAQEYEIPYQSYWAQLSASAPQYAPMPACMNDKQRTASPFPVPEMQVTGAQGVAPINSVNATEMALQTVGPQAAIIYVPNSFENYEGGIYSDAECEGNDLMLPSHAIQIVGFGFDADNGLDYWIVRNSWSPWWGESGYIRMLKKPQGEDCGGMFWFPDPNAAPPLELTWMQACGPCGLLLTNTVPVISI